MSETSGDTVDEVLQRVTAGDVTEENVDLLFKAFSSGYPPRQLTHLLGSERNDVVEAAVWIASELGSGAAELVAEVTPLLRHSSGQVRFFALAVILDAAEPSDTEALVAAVRSIDDTDEAVRWKTMNFLARATTEQLWSALDGLRGSDLSQHLVWLLKAEEAGRATDFRAKLLQGDSTGQRFAAAAAARLVDVDLSLLRQAALTETAEIAKFAQQHLRYAAIVKQS